jgi:sorbitol/mannitol transport system permease protein
MSTTTRPRITRPIRPNVTRNPLSESWRRRLPLLPALLIMIVLTQVPFVMSVYYSLTDWRVVPPEPRNWVGLENYRNLFDNQFFKDATVVTIQLTVFPVLGALVLGAGFALLLDRKFFGQGLVRTLLITPFLVMPIAAAMSAGFVQRR